MRGGVSRVWARGQMVVVKVRAKMMMVPDRERLRVEMGMAERGLDDLKEEGD